jgi:HK97 family phage portal protein
MKRVPRVLERARHRAEHRSGYYPAMWPGAAGGSSAGSSAFLPAPVLSGVAVTPETALTFAAVFAAINVLASDTASLPLEVVRRRAGGRAPVTSHPATEVLGSAPNDDTTPFRYFQACMGHVLGWGNSYSEIERDAGGYPVALHILSPRPADTWPVRTKGGVLQYAADGGRRTVAAEDVLHLAGLSWDGLIGYSPVALQRQTMGLGIAQVEFGAAFYGNGTSPRGALKVARRLSPEGKRNLRESWEGVHSQTVNAHRLAILEEGTEWQNISISPVDAEYLESRRFQVIEVARIYRIPPHKIGDYSQAHLANVEASNIDYLNTSLMCWLVMIQQELNRKFFTRRERAHGLRITHDLTALLRGDMQARANYYKTRFDIASLTPDEIREREGDNPYPGEVGNTAYRPLNLAPLGAPPPPPAPETPEAPVDDAAPAGTPSTNGRHTTNGTAH